MTDKFSGGDYENSGFGKKLESLLPETFKKVFIAGVGALFMTEEGIRKVLGDLTLPKDVISYILQQTEQTKKEFFNIIAKEFSQFLKAMAVKDGIESFFENHELEVNATFRFKQSENKETNDKNADVVKIRNIKTKSKKKKKEE